jgi:predicted MPP superfamily phosphohydrolase
VGAAGSLRVAVLTDLHVGSPFNGLAKLRDVVDRTNAARPDLVCILGDLVIQGIIGGRFVAPEAIAGELMRLRPAVGTFAVLGNHDGWLDHDRMRRALEAAGVHLVEDTAISVATASGPVWIAGISDLWTGRRDLSAALAASRTTSHRCSCSRTIRMYFRWCRRG